ncbi:MAG: hypothetical protein FVQ84_21620 [Planctomycetes bacterium]|nr:hypothetical protein [Planctomycetota bacterium]
MQKFTFLLICYIVCLNLLLAVIIFKPGPVEQLAKRLGWRKSSHTEHYNRMLAFHRRIDACVPENAVIFIGDSFIQGMCVSAIVEGGVNFGVGGDTTAGVLKRLSMYTSIKRARAIVLAVGFNNLRERNNSQIVKNYREILLKMPENVKVVFCSVLPIDETCRSERYNDRIIELNRSSAEICSSMENCQFVDLAEKLRDTQGNLSRHYHEGDGIHLNSKGYSIYNETLKASLISVMQ